MYNFVDDIKHKHNYVWKEVDVSIFLLVHAMSWWLRHLKKYLRVYYRYCFEKIIWMLKEVESVISKIYVSNTWYFYLILRTSFAMTKNTSTTYNPTNETRSSSDLMKLTDFFNKSNFFVLFSIIKTSCRFYILAGAGSVLNFDLVKRCQKYQGYCQALF